MTTKQKLTSGVRKMLPANTVSIIEDTYRRSRVKIVSARHGNPSKRMRVIAVTGTNGKTTTINYINSILKHAGYKTAMFSTAVIEINGNAKINDLNATVATTDQMQKFFKQAKKAKVDFVVLEVTSHALHQHKLSTVPIEMAIMTNLTQDHLDYHKTMDNYAAAKAILFKKSPRYVVLNMDDEWFDYFNKYNAGEQKITYGKGTKKNQPDALIKDIKSYSDGSVANISIDHQVKIKLSTHMPGEYNVYNATAAAAATYLLGLSTKDIVGGIKTLEVIPGRFETIKINKPFDVVVDYAHTPDALEKLLQTAKKISKSRVILVFGATGDRDKTKRPIMGSIAAKYADRIFLTDEESYNENPDKIRKMIMDGIKKSRATGKVTEIPDREEAIKRAIKIAKKGDIVLVTGMGHEKFRIIEGKKVPWSDAEVVLNA